MQETRMVTWDANEATAYVAYRTNEVIAIYPITPASPMGEHSDAWAARDMPNLWGDVPEVAEMQSEGGAAGAVHGSMQAGALTTTFTASQGLLLMMPNMFKMAGELNVGVIHVAARSIATHALSIFGDHSDVYAARGTGFAMLSSNSVQEAHDFALIAQSATLRTRLPFLHFFDGFRTSHEVSKTAQLSDDQMRAMIDMDAIRAHRQRAINPEHPVVRGTAQNPDVFFQAREAVNPFYEAAPEIIQQTMDQFGEVVGRHYKLFDYVGDPKAERVIVLMGSGAETADETVEWMAHRGEKVGVVKVRLFRPFSRKHLLAALPETTKAIAVLDRTKEPGANQPLYLDVVSALHDARQDGETTLDPRIVGGRYGLSSKEFTPAMIVGVFENLSADRPMNDFTVGINDDLTHSNLSWDPTLDIEPDDVHRAVFYGLGSDGTVGANKNTIKIIGGETSHYAQGYFVYDSKKSGAVTISHVRFGPRPIRSTYLIQQAHFVGVHQFVFLEKYDVLKYALPGSVFLLNSIYGPDRVWEKLPREVQEGIVEKQLKFYVIDAYKVARDTGMGGRINTIMQTSFFAISGVLPRDEAIAQIKKSIQKTYGKKGDELVQMNFAAVDRTVENLHPVTVPATINATWSRPPTVSDKAPDLVKRVTAMIMAGNGDRLPVSAFPPDGTFPTATTQWEKRAVAQEIPIWESDVCIQCNKCALVCPHAAIRPKIADPAALEAAPEGFRSTPTKGRDFPGTQYIIQVAPEDCTGCKLCVDVCPAKDKANPGRKAINMAPLVEHREVEAANWDFFMQLPDPDRKGLRKNVKDTQFMRPLIEFSGACAGCGETPYIKLLTQLFGDRLLVANATGCSSIYGGNLPTTPYAVDHNGRGPAWSNSLFEDNAEFGMGFRLAVDSTSRLAQRLLRALTPQLGAERVAAILDAPQVSEEQIETQRERVAQLVKLLADIDTPESTQLVEIADYLVTKSVWLVGGDGWAYDIGYGGLDHVLASGRNINVLVMDTQVYSNTGGQASKATPLAAMAKFAAAGKDVPKKDLGMLAMAYGNVYVAQIAFGAKDAQTVKAIAEAQAYDGPSIIIAYSHCIAHGYDMGLGIQQQKKAVATGFWPLYRFDPTSGKLHIDSKAPSLPLEDFAYNEGRFGMLRKSDPERAAMLLEKAQATVTRRFATYQALAGLKSKPDDK